MTGQVLTPARERRSEEVAGTEGCAVETGDEGPGLVRVRQTGLHCRRLGGDEAGDGEGGAAQALEDQRETDAGDGPGEEGDVGGRAEEGEAGEHEGAAQAADQPGGDVAITEPTHDRDNQYGADGETEEGHGDLADSVPLLQLEEGSEGGLQGPDGVGVDHGREERDEDRRV